MSLAHVISVALTHTARLIVKQAQKIVETSTRKGHKAGLKVQDTDEIHDQTHGNDLVQEADHHRVNIIKDVIRLIMETDTGHGHEDDPQKETIKEIMAGIVNRHPAEDTTITQIVITGPEISQENVDLIVTTMEQTEVAIKITTEMIEITIKIEIMRTDKTIIVIGIMDVVILFHQEDNTIPHHGTGHIRAIPIKIGTVVIANK